MVVSNFRPTEDPSATEPIQVEAKRIKKRAYIKFGTEYSNWEVIWHNDYINDGKRRMMLVERIE